MKRISSVTPKVPRLKSLLHRLQQTPGPEEQPYLEQLMIFLDDPPAGVGDRWARGAEMCTAWGIATSGASVWRLYRSYVIEWRARLALQMDDVTSRTNEELAQKAARLIALRTCEMLANADTPPATLVSLARIDLRQRMLHLAEEKHRDTREDDLQRALKHLRHEAAQRRDAKFALDRLEEALGRPTDFTHDLYNLFTHGIVPGPAPAKPGPPAPGQSPS